LSAQTCVTNSSVNVLQQYLLERLQLLQQPFLQVLGDTPYSAQDHIVHLYSAVGRVSVVVLDVYLSVRDDIAKYLQR
jgi:hypothetical protein